MTPLERIAHIVDGPRPPAALAGASLVAERGGDDGYSPQGESADQDMQPSNSGSAPADPEVLKESAKLDHSDTDNGVRLLRHFGCDLKVFKEEGAKEPSYAAWAGTHWDLGSGNLYAHRVAQKVGAMILLEADLLEMTHAERQAVAAGEEKAAHAALAKRRSARRKFAVSSKNAARIAAMLKCAAPHCAAEPDDFNFDPYLFATKGHTIKFVRERDDECPDPDAIRMAHKIEVIDGHRREDMLTRLVPVDYSAGAACPLWLAFLSEFLPDAQVRAFVQTFSGLGLLGRAVQKLVFHYGLGANGKSVFLETLTRVLGPLAVGLPAESITGQKERAAGAASPDLARLYGARMLRVLELPADKPLHEELVKKLTGGEKIPVRTLFKGYFEFTPAFSCHMSGNGYPRIDGTDNGIWRRIAVVHWPLTIPTERQKEFEEVLASFAPEYPGILNWLIKGALRFLEGGLPEPPAVVAATQDYRSEMDPVADFIADCIEVKDGESETARTLYEAYVSWSMANAKRHVFETKFARVMRQRFTRTDERVRRYLNVRLHDVPARPDGAPQPQF